MDSGSAAHDSGSQGSSSTPTQDERTWALLGHLLTIVASFIAPLVIWLVKKEESDFVADQALESLNFQVTLVLAYVVCVPLVCVGVGLFLIPVVAVFGLVMAILAGIRAYEGQRYRYPLALRLIR